MNKKSFSTKDFSDNAQRLTVSSSELKEQPLLNAEKI